MVLAPSSRRLGFAFALCLIQALAQGASTVMVNGVVKDSSGQVFPGVTVEAVSLALIENVRSTVTDERGEYRPPNCDPART